MFWVVVKKNSGFVGLVSPDRITGSISNSYIEPENYKKVTGLSYKELNHMYPRNIDFKLSSLYNHFTDCFKLTDSKESEMLSFYKFK